MSRSKKFVVVLLAVWLPLFSGNALAGAIAMQSHGGGCQTVVAQQPQQATAMHQHMHHAQLVVQSVMDQAQSAEPQDQHDSSCKDSAVCHQACSVYLATLAIKVAEAQPSAQLFTSPSTQFQSFTSAPLDPPPLARV